MNNITAADLLILWEEAFSSFKKAEDVSTGLYLSRDACDNMREMWPKFGSILNELRITKNKS